MVKIAATAGLAAVPAAIGMGAVTGQIDWMTALGMLTAAYSGWNPVTSQWEPGLALANYGAIFGGAAASKLAAKTGINRMYPKGVNL